MLEYFTTTALLCCNKGMAIHRVSSSSRVRVEFELMVELAHARSIFSFYSPDSNYG